MRSTAWMVALALAVACGGDDDDTAIGDGGSSDTGAADGGASDGGSSDGGASDGGSSDTGAADGGATDGGATDTGDDTGGSGALDGYGEISGDCGVLDDEEWNGDQPWLYRNAIDLDGEPSTDELTAGGQEIYADGNLGGSSIWSEVFAFEVLDRCELAELVKTEAEIAYDTEGDKTDLLVEIDGRRVGVSVTRAYHYPPDEPYTEEEAADLLERKLGGVLEASANVSADDAWTRSILHVIAYDAQYADMIEVAWATVDPAVASDTIVYVTVSDGDDAFLY